MVYAFASLLLFYVIVKSNVHWTYRKSVLLYVFSIILLIAVLIPGIGVERNGSQSWIGFAGYTFQPAELVKISTLLLLSQVLGERKSYAPKVQWREFLVIVTPVALIMLQPDFGAVFLLVVSSVILLFISNYPMKVFVLMIIFGFSGFIGLIASAPYRIKRITAFLNPWEDPLNSGFQAVQSLMAIGPGGLLGHGFLKSRQKYLYLPEPQNDFIFSIILEEVGLVGGTIIVIIFACFLWSNFQLALLVKEKVAFYSIVSLTSLIAVQTILNMSVVVGLLPVTGVTLPFISYGGTSLIFVWLIVAIVNHFSKL